MFTHRFEQQLMEQHLAPRTPGLTAFVPMPVQGADWQQWLYQKAFEEARNDVLADRRARMLAASRN